MNDVEVGFSTVIAVDEGWSSDDLRDRLAATAVDFVAYVDGEVGRARRVDTALEQELNALAASERASALLDSAEYIVHTEQRGNVDSAYRARRILSKRSPVRTLLVLDGDAPVTVFSLDTASAPVDEPEVLHWVTDLPDDKSLMASRLLLMGSTPWFRTRIAADAGTAAGQVSTIELAAFKDRKISFGLVGENVAFRLPGETKDLPSVDSEFVDPLGPDASYRVQLVPQQPGPVAVQIEIWFDDDENHPDTQRIEFTVIDVPDAARTADSSTTVSSIDLPETALMSMPFAVPPEASIWVRWAGEQLEYDIDGITRSHRVAASLGEFEGRELRALMAEVEHLCGSFAAGDVPGSLADDGAALLGFAQLGARLHAMVYGKDEYDVSDDVSNRASAIAALGVGSTQPPRLRIEDDRLRLPWELFYDHGYTAEPGTPSRRIPQTVADVDINGFWGRRFRIDHPVARGDRTARRPGDHVLADTDVRLTPFINAAIADDAVLNAGLVGRNASMLQRLGDAGIEVEPTGSDLLAWVARNAPTDVLYLYGHGTSATGEDALGRESSQPADSQASLSLGHGEISVADLEAAEPSPPFLSGSPLVLLNACKTLSGDLDYRNPFVDLLCRRWRARAIVGGIASLPADFAIDFADRLLSRFLTGGVQLGDCLHSTINELLDEANPFGLLYALHGRSELQVRSAR